MQMSEGNKVEDTDVIDNIDAFPVDTLDTDLIMLGDIQRDDQLGSETSRNHGDPPVDDYRRIKRQSIYPPNMTPAIRKSCLKFDVLWANYLIYHASICLVVLVLIGNSNMPTRFMSTY